MRREPLPYAGYNPYGYRHEETSNPIHPPRKLQWGGPNPLPLPKTQAEKEEDEAEMVAVLEEHARRYPNSYRLFGAPCPLPPLTDREREKIAERRRKQGLKW